MPSYVTSLLTPFCNQLYLSSMKENKQIVQFVLQILACLCVSARTV